VNLPFVALALSLLLAWLNFVTTGRWAALDGALNGWKQPWYAAALLLATGLAVVYRQRVGRGVRVGIVMPAIFLTVGVTVLVACLFSRFPLSSWTLIPFDDDWTPLFQTAADGVSLLKRGVVMGWNWKFLGGYAASTDVAQSFALHAFLPMALFGDRLGFHVLHAIWLLAVPLFVWWDLRQEDRHTALVAAAIACFLTASYSVTLGKSGDVNSLAGVFSAGLALVGSSAARAGRRWGGPALVLGLTLALYSHVAFFVYACIYLVLEAAYFRDRWAFVRFIVAAAVATIASLPVHFESLRYGDYVSFNNVVYSPAGPIDWPLSLRTLYYNVELLALPHRWFNDYRSLANVWLPVLIVAAWRSPRSRTGFYACAAVLTQMLLRLNTGEFGAGFDRIMHMLPLLVAPALAGFIVRFGGTRGLAYALFAAIAIYPAASFKPVPHVSSVRSFSPALIDRVATLDGNLVLFEISPHRDMDSDPVRRTPKAPWNVHFEALLPSVAGQRFYGQMWDGWMFSSWRGQVVGAGSFMGQALAETPVDVFAGEMRRWGVRHLVVWTDASRSYLAGSGRFVERWRDGLWSQFEFLDADVRSVETIAGQGRLTNLDPLWADVQLDGVTAGEQVIARTNYYPAWQASVDGRPIELYSHAGQLAFDAPASGSYIVRLEYPKRRWLSLIALGALLFGMVVLARGADQRMRWTVGPADVG